MTCVLMLAFVTSGVYAFFAFFNQDFVDDRTSIPIGVFPDVYVNFRRTSVGSPFRWGDEASTELPSTDG